jgi:hypothetical protein
MDRAEELALLKRIERNAHKVPKLSMLIGGLLHGGNWYFNFSIEGEFTARVRSDTADGHAFRSFGMALVDVIEDAELAWFDRERDGSPLRMFVWEALSSDFCESVGCGSNQQEHLALLDCVAQTLEWLAKEDGDA